ncbi:MAG: (d)CMP kinase [Planctomycetes bacterium]|nr:(d)CMP kinase [Planctomycetota bacterium]
MSADSQTLAPLARRDAARTPLQVVALDGPAGAGKSTVARELARRLGWHRLDTGASYRALTWCLLERGVLRSGADATAAELSAALLGVDLQQLGVALDHDGTPTVAGRRLGDAELRAQAVDRLVSPLSQLAVVREFARALQRRFVDAGGPAVVDGRDIGTVVFPDAPHKFFLDADLDVRAARRHAEELARGRDVSFEAVRAAIAERDARDAGRELSPLRAADDAERVDTSALTVDEVVELLAARIGVAAPAAGRAATAAPPAGAPERYSGLVPWFYWLSHAVARLFIRVWLRRRRVGAEHVPARGAVLLIANHQSFLDPPLVGTAVGRTVHFLARRTLARVPVFGAMIRWQGTLFVDKDGSARGGLGAAAQALAAGRAVCVFPEGTRSDDGHVHEFQRGVLLLVRRARCPVVPIGIRGAGRAFGRGAKWIRPVRCEIHFGPALPAADVLTEGGLERVRQQVRILAGDV